MSLVSRDRMTSQRPCSNSHGPITCPHLGGGRVLMSAPRAVGGTGFWVAPLWLENIIPSSREESEASWNKRGSKNPRRKEAPLSRTHLHIGPCVCVCTYMYIPAPTTHVIYYLFILVLELIGNPARKQESQGSFSKILSGPALMSVQNCMALCLLALGS